MPPSPHVIEHGDQSENSVVLHKKPVVDSSSSSGAASAVPPPSSTPKFDICLAYTSSIFSESMSSKARATSSVHA